MSEKAKSEEVDETLMDNEIQEEQNEANASEEVVEGLSTEEKLKEELSTEKDKFLRLFAEFENYKRRTSKERMELFKTAGQEVMISLLPVMDDFDRALAEIAKSEDEVLLKGVELIHNKFSDTLKSKGLEQVVLKAGDDFDVIFEKTYYSHQFGRRKPDGDSFSALLKENDLQPEETLFVDDSIQHIESARKIGIRTFHLMDTDILNEFE